MPSLFNKTSYKKPWGRKPVLFTALLFLVGGLVLFANAQSAMAAALYDWEAFTWTSKNTFTAALYANNSVDPTDIITFKGPSAGGAGTYTATKALNGSCKQQFKVAWDSTNNIYNPSTAHDCGTSTLGNQSGGSASFSDPNSKGPPAPGKSGTAPDDSGSAKTQAPTLECNVVFTNPLTWFVCPLISTAQNAINSLQAGIDSLLDVNTCAIFSSNSSCTDAKGNPTSGNAKEKDTSGGFYKAWNSFRLFAVGIIIIAGLVMIISQAAGIEIFDAYTIRKILPRLLIAIIFVSLSWPILQFLISLSNDAGLGVRAIIYAPFTHIGTDVTITGGTSSVGFLIGGAALWSLGIVALGSFVLTAMLAVLVGFIILLLRQMIVLMLVIFAPLAIACYVMPNTQKVWNFWKDTFISMLVAFPIISAFIALGRVFAVVMYNGAVDVPGIIREFGALIAFFLPYFLLPFAFRMAGGAIANVAGMVNSKGRGGFDRLKGFRQKSAASRMQDRVQRAQTENLFKGKNKVSSALSTAAFGVSNAGKAGVNPLNMRGKLQSARSNNSFDEVGRIMKESGIYRANQGDDEVLAGAGALAEGKSNKEVRDIMTNLAPDRFKDEKNLNEAMVRAQQLQHEGSNDAIQKLSVKGRVLTGTGFVTDKDGNARDKMAHAIAGASGGNIAEALRMTGEAQADAMKTGRIDLGGADARTTRDEVLKVMRDPSEHVDDRKWLRSVALNQDSVTLLRGKPRSTTDVMGSIQKDMVELSSNKWSGNAEDRERVSKEFPQLIHAMQQAQQTRMYASPTAINIINKTAGNVGTVVPEVNVNLGQQGDYDPQRDREMRDRMEE